MVKYKLAELLRATGGVATGLLIDAGMRREFRCEYDFTELPDGKIELRKRGRAGAARIQLPAEIDLTPAGIAFLGMYSGDGNKTGAIGFAQRNVELLEVSCFGMAQIFGDAVPLAVNLLNDSRYFMRPEFLELVTSAGLQQDQLPTLPARQIPQQLRDHLWGEFQEEVSHLKRLANITSYSATISPLKGAREAGGESREYIVSIPNSTWLLPIMLTMIEHLNDSLMHDEQRVVVNGREILDWGNRPSQIVYYEVDLHDFVTASDECRWFSNGNERRYRVASRVDGVMELGNNPPFRCRQIARIGPLTSYAAGLYLAEGTTDKATLMHFHERQCGPVALSFNSSEGTSLAIFLHSMRECLGFPEEAISSWKVKVGSQYMYESQVVGEFFQAPMIRKGEKGQGKSASCIQAGLFKAWAMQEFEELRSASNRFSHVEYTGAGVPRVQVTCSSAPARLVFSLYRMATGGLLDACRTCD